MNKPGVQLFVESAGLSNSSTAICKIRSASFNTASETHSEHYFQSTKPTTVCVCSTSPPKKLVKIQ